MLTNLPIKTEEEYDACIYVIDAITEFIDEHPEDASKEIVALHSLMEMAHNYELARDHELQQKRAERLSDANNNTMLTCLQAAGLLNLLPVDIIELVDLGQLTGVENGHNTYVHEESVLSFKERHDHKKTRALQMLSYRKSTES